MTSLKVVCIIASSILAVRLAFFALSGPQYQDGQNVTVRGTLLTEPNKHSYNQSFTLSHLRITVPLTERLHYGDTIEVKGVIDKKEQQSALRTRTIYSLVNPTLKVLPPSLPLQGLAVIRSKIQELFASSLDPVPASLMLGIVFGIRDSIDPVWFDRYRTTGVLHVVAASGANISILASVLISILGILLKRRVAIVVAICLICVYAVFSGLSPSIVRASLMAIAAYTASLIGRQSWTIGNICMSAYIMLMIDPVALGDIGFQLSFASTLGIVTIKPLFDRVLSKFKIQNVLSDITTSSAAQIATTPILLYAFGSYSLISLLVNTLILWTVAPLMMLGGAASVLGLLLPFFGKLIIFLTYPLLWYFLQVVKIGASMPLTISLPVIVWPWIVGYYCVLAAGVIALQKKSNEG